MVSVGPEKSLQTLTGKPVDTRYVTPAAGVPQQSKSVAEKEKEGEEEVIVDEEEHSGSGKEREKKGKKEEKKKDKKGKSEKRKKGKEEKEKGGKKKKGKGEKSGSESEESSSSSSGMFSPEEIIHEAHRCMYEGKEVEYWTDDLEARHPMPPVSLKGENQEEFKLKLFLRGRAQAVIRNRKFRAKESQKRKKGKEKKEARKSKKVKVEDKGGKKNKTVMEAENDSDVQEIAGPAAKNVRGKEKAAGEKQGGEGAGQITEEVLKQLQELALTKYKCQQLEKELLAEKKMKEDLEKQSKTQAGKIEKLKEQLEGSRGEVAGFKAGTKDVKENFSTAIETLQVSVTTLMAQHDSLRIELQQSKEEKKEREEEIEKLKKEMVEKEKEKTKLEHDNLVLQSKLEGMCLSLQHQAGQAGGGGGAISGSPRRLLGSLIQGEGPGTTEGHK